MNDQIKEIIWNLVNALLAASLVIVGACSTGNLTYESFGLALVAGLVVGINQFKSFWETEKEEYCPKRLGAFF